MRGQTAADRLWWYAKGYNIPWRCVWLGHRLRPNQDPRQYQYRCTRPNCSFEYSPAGSRP